ncbi:DUF3795 domain-containing protein [Wukongibacter baidiensis]|uniref:DUF3795 domain-containing protein n=1 Tax=Wukongibacter baidiensis TaxID=1723361 RepID=UPI003D7FFAB2
MGNIAYCGLLCNECPAYIATKEEDNAKKEVLAQEWSSDDYILDAKDINCNGCSKDSSGPIFKFCKECEIRRCGIERNIDNCAYCADYPCSKLDKPFEMSPDNKERLDNINR